MDAKSLIFLVEIIDAGNLSRAARRLKMTRANVSYHLNRLEQSIGQQLVRRTTRHIEPTDIGLKLYAHGQQIRSELLHARDSVRELGDSLRGRVRVSVPSGFGQQVMAAWLIEFKRMHPGIVLDVVFENHVTDLLREEVDVSIRVMSNPPENLVARYIAPVRYVACASSSYADKHGMPGQLTQLSDFPILTSNVSGRQLRLTAYQDNAHEQVVLEPTLISENFGFLREAILAGLGVGIVPNYVVNDDIRQGTIKATLSEWYISIFGTKMFMLYMSNRYHTRSMSVFIEFILDKAKSRINESAKE